MAGVEKTEWRVKFLKTLSSTGNVLVSCRVAGVGRATAYRHRERLPKFRAAWDEAVEESTDAMEAEARRRAQNGVEKPVFYQGNRVATVKEYSDTLLIFLLKANRPEKYRDNPPPAPPDDRDATPLDPKIAEAVRKAIAEATGVKFPEAP
jgi:hypothetical protein